MHYFATSVAHGTKSSSCVSSKLKTKINATLSGHPESFIFYIYANKIPFIKEGDLFLFITLLAIHLNYKIYANNLCV